MKKIILLLGIIVSFQAISQVTPRYILSKKYTLAGVAGSLISQDNFKPYPKSSAEWQSRLSAKDQAEIIKEAEGLIDYDFPPINGSVSMDYQRSGDRLRHSGISFTKRNNLMALVIAETIEDKGRFTETIFNGVWSICEESFWGVPAHIRASVLPDVDDPIVDLFAAETASLLSLTDYFIGDKLDEINPLIRKRIYSETNRRMFVPMQTNSDRYSYMSKTRQVNNWNPWIMSNYMLSNLLIEKDEKRRAQMLYQAMEGLDLYLNSLGDDGGCDEGPSYWFAAGGSVYDCLELLDKSTNGAVNIFDNELIKKMASYVYKTHIHDKYFVNFADADPTAKADGLMLYRFGKAINDPRMVEFGKWGYQNFPNEHTSGFMRMRRVENLLTTSQIPAKGNNYTPVKDAWVSDIQVLTARSDQGLFLATHGGHNAESHNHNDVGDFIIYLRGQPMIIDAGRGNYTARTFSAQRYELWFTQSNYHNLPLINGVGQKAGREFEAHEVKSTVSSKEATLDMNIAQAYPSEAGIKNWNRKVKLDRTKNTVNVTDNYELNSKPNDFKQILMTICKIDVSQSGIIKLSGDENTELNVKYDPKMWSVSTELPSTEGMEYESFNKKWDGKTVTRIVLTQKNPSVKGSSSLEFVPN
ncbi:Heparinase II/III-like protein [Spirosomataceae bacterium TFI 002]|nr:Heparinase II/III-like protein [Spirosomataceae bacterium TFI 002]